MEASPENFFSSKFSRELTGSFWKKKKNTEAHKVLGNPGKTIVFEVIGVKSEFWLKDLDDIPSPDLYTDTDAENGLVDMTSGREGGKGGTT